MSASLISRSPDLKRLRDEGYSISIVAGQLVVSEVPFVSVHRTVERGRLVVPLSLAGDAVVAPRGHQARWAGGKPCDARGQPLSKVIRCAAVHRLENGIVTDHWLCKVPLGREFVDYHELVTGYVALIAGHATAIDPTATAMTHRGPISSHDPDTPFQYIDTATSRAGTGALAARLAEEAVAIVGLGGTGSYVLDLVAKTPVRTIHLFDGDTFDQHNAFRAPGAPSKSDLAARRAKVDHFAGIYSNMHRGIVPHAAALDRKTLRLLDHIGFAFLCIDDAAAKRPIIARLEKLAVPFIDVGIGLEITEDGLIGTARVTTSTPAMRDHVKRNERIPFATGGEPDAYGSNVQVADLNALNAALAVIRWKRMRGFYAEAGDEHHSAFVVGTNQLLNDDRLPTER